ncbi:hypothetical protein D3C72_1328860 [compost metagenome]
MPLTIAAVPEAVAPATRAGRAFQSTLGVPAKPVQAVVPESAVLAPKVLRVSVVRAELVAVVSWMRAEIGVRPANMPAVTGKRT